MRFLLMNDDGIDAPGLAALEQAAAQVGEVFVVAPNRELSCCAHQVTTRRPLAVHKVGHHRWSVDGFPADCARLALRGLGLEVDWVLAGINAGGNLGADTFISGTVSAVREGLLFGKPGIVFSHYKRRDLPLDWGLASAWAEPLLRELVERGVEAGHFWNVNFPHLPAGTPTPEVLHCPLDLSQLSVQYRLVNGAYVYESDYHARPRQPGSDVDVCFSGKVAVSLIRAG